jgi:hypothetical protein
MVVLILVLCWSPVTVTVTVTSGGGGESESGDNSYSSDPPDDDETPKYLFSRSGQGSPLRIEVVAILPDASNASLSFSKALSRALNSVSSGADGQGEEEDEDYAESGDNRIRNITWRVKNFVIANSTVDLYETSSSPFNRKGYKKYKTPLLQRLGMNITFSPSLVPRFCDFLSRTKALAMINLIGDVGGERMLSLLSTATALPLIGSSQFENPLQTLHKVRIYRSY